MDCALPVHKAHTRLQQQLEIMIVEAAASATCLPLRLVVDKSKTMKTGQNKQQGHGYNMQHHPEPYIQLARETQCGTHTLMLYFKYSKTLSAEFSVFLF